jgi:hypothetical protein
MKEVRILSKGISFDGFQLSKSVTKLFQHLLSFSLDISQSEFIIWTEENVLFKQDFMVIPSPPADQCISKWVRRLEIDGGGESKGRKGVFRDFAVDGLCRSF